MQELTVPMPDNGPLCKILVTLNLGFPIYSKIDEATSKADQKKKISKKPLPVITSKYNKYITVVVVVHFGTVLCE